LPLFSNLQKYFSTTMPAFFNFLKILLIPNGLIFLALLLLPAFHPVPQILWPYASFYPYIFYGAAALLCWRFHKDRYLFAILSIGAAERAVYYLLAVKSGAIPADTLLYNGIGMVVALNWLIFELIKDRGLFTFRGILRWVLITAEVVFLGMVYLNPRAEITHVIRDFLDVMESYLPAVMPNPVMMVFLGALTILLLRLLLRQVPVESSSVWALTLLSIGFAQTGRMAELSYCCASAALIVIAAILESSYRLAYYDELTGLPARRALNDQLMRLGSKFTIAMADIDHFKKFNDRYGHDVGDQVLKMVAAKLKTVSGGGKPFRYGGEEFAVIFSGSDKDAAKPCLETLRKTIETTKFTLRGFGRAFKKKGASKSLKRPQRSVKITVSIGVAEKTARHADARAVIKAADKALYRAKRLGRNRVSA
jgi:diguanylate cyclase (GGDEF)-like protein